MPNWSGTVLTNKGLALQAKIEAGTTMQITKIKIGDGALNSGQTVAALNDLVSPQKNISVSALTPLSNGVCKVTAVVTNDGLETGFYVRELGIFAQDPDLGEILYAYTADGAPDFLPADGGPVAVSEELVVNLAFSNAATITASIAMDGLVTVNVLNNAITIHNNDPDAHPGVFLPLAGGAMTGPLVLADDPEENMQAVTKQYLEQFIKTNANGVGIGTVLPFLATKAQPGWLALDTGELVSRATYPQLWQWVQANAPLITEAAWQTQAAAQTSVGAYSSGDGSTTFRLPRLVDFVRGSDGTRLPGTWRDSQNKVHNHPIYTGNDDAPSSGAGAGNGIAIDYSNPTVSGGTAVKITTAIGPDGGTEANPKYITMLFCVKAFDAPTNQGLIDITALAGEVASKQKTLKYAEIYEIQPTGTNGGTFSAGAWRTRNLNTIQFDNIGISILNYQFILPAGTYEVFASLPGYLVGNHKGRLQDITNGVTLLLGTNETVNPTNYAHTTRSIISGVFTIASTTTLEVQHYSSNTGSFGQASAIAGVNELYAQIHIRKVA